MKISNKLFYCTFFDNRNQQSVLRNNGSRLCLLISTDDFPLLLNLGLTVLVSAQFHDKSNTIYDDMDISYNNAVVIARGNAKRLLTSLSTK